MVKIPATGQHGNFLSAAFLLSQSELLPQMARNSKARKYYGGKCIKIHMT
jgi:hypothetical protein